MQVAARILQHPQSMLAMTKQEIEKKGLVIETIRQHHIQGSGIPGQRAIEESQPRRDFILPQSVGAPDPASAAAQARHQHHRNLPW